MEALWICEHCKSVNRAHARRCYKCGEGRPDQALIVNDRPAVTPVVTPGLDDAHFDVAWTLHVRHGYIQAWPLGYLSALLFFLTYLGVVSIVALVIGGLLVNGLSSSGAFDPGSTLLPASAALTVATGLVALAAYVCHSIFLALADYDVPALGGGSPRYNPLRAGLWWIECGVWAFLAYLVFNLPLMVILVMVLFVVLLSSAGLVVGGIGCGLVLWGMWSIGIHPLQWLTWPERLLRDLFNRLALPGQSDSRLVSYYTMAWATTNGVNIAILVVSWALFALLFVVGIVVALAGNPLTIEASGIASFALAIEVLALLVESVASVALAGLTIAITISLSRRLRVRERWFRASMEAARQQLASQGGAAGLEAPPQP